MFLTHHSDGESCIVDSNVNYLPKYGQVQAVTTEVCYRAFIMSAKSTPSMWVLYSDTSVSMAPLLPAPQRSVALGQQRWQKHGDLHRAQHRCPHGQKIFVIFQFASHQLVLPYGPRLLKHIGAFRCKKWVKVDNIVRGFLHSCRTTFPPKPNSLSSVWQTQNSQCERWVTDAPVHTKILKPCFFRSAGQVLPQTIIPSVSTFKRLLLVSSRTGLTFASWSLLEIIFYWKWIIDKHLNLFSL